MSNRTLIVGVVVVLAVGVAVWLLLRSPDDRSAAHLADGSAAVEDTVPPQRDPQPTPGNRGAVRPMLEVGQTAPNFELERLDDGSFSLEDHEGEVVLVNFWATWCAPCREEMPDLQQLWDAYGDEGLLVVGVSLDENGRSVVEEFHQTFPVEYPLLLNGRQVAAEYGADQVVPTTFLIGRDGRVAARHIGAVTKDEFELEVRRAL